VNGFHTATICADCDPPVVAISTGNGSRCPECGQVETWPASTIRDLGTRADGVLARRILVGTAVRSDGDALLLAELARRLLDRPAAANAERVKQLEDELSELRDLADLVDDADIGALPPELVAVKQRWFADRHARAVAEAEGAGCPHCVAGEPSVWDDVLFHYAHPDGDKLKTCHSPWRERCRRCSADAAPDSKLCARHATEAG